MKVLIRKTITGSEYWDTEVKRTLFVPKGEKPSFEVTDNPESMLKEPEQREPGDGINIEELTIKQLYEFAKQIDIEIPKDITKKDDIIAYLSDTK